MIIEFFDFFPYMNLKIVTAIFRDALFLLFDMREAYAGSPPPPLSEIVQLSFRYISFHEVSHWNKPFFAIILRTTKIYPLRLKIVGSRIEMIKESSKVYNWKEPHL